MHMKNEEKEEKAPAQAPQPKSTAGPKVWKYIGPTPAPVIRGIPGSRGSWRADALPQQHIQFVLDTVPAAKYWWE